MESNESADIRVELFFKRAREEALRYGGDRWVFLRELVQNSRDAGASSIHFATTSGGDVEEITCRDNGSGMDRLEVERYFLRLYASSKEQDEDLLGYFGVGFWSVLLFEPSVIKVVTRKGNETISFEIHCTTSSLRHTDCTLDRPGTEITLQRNSEGAQGRRSFEDTVRERLIYYAGHIRPVPGMRTIDLSLNMEGLNRPFPEPPLSPRRFKAKTFDGVLGLGPVPSVKIYKGGILVSDLATLDEVIPSRKTMLPKTGWGMYPSVVINIDGLKLLLDRRRIFEDPLLYEAAHFCEHELVKLHHKLIKRSLPMNLRNGLLRFVSRLSAKAAVALSVFFLVLVTAIAVANHFADRIRTASLAQPLAQTSADGIGPSHVYQRESVDVPLSAWTGPNDSSTQISAFLGDLSYDGSARLLFRLRTFSRFDAKRGLIPEVHRIVGEYPSLGARGTEKISVEIGVSGGPDPFVLPVPDEHVLIKESLRIGMERGQDVRMNTFQEPMVQVSRPARLNYDVVRADTVLASLAPSEMPDFTWPDHLESLLTRVQRYPVDRRVLEIRDLIRHNYAYAHSVPVRTLFQPRPAWISDVLARRQGDCDVLNSLAVLLMRSAGIQAYLSVGLVGTEGRAVPGLHAWARYFENGWQILDVTEDVPVLTTGDDLVTDPHDGGDSAVGWGDTSPDRAPRGAGDKVGDRLYDGDEPEGTAIGILGRVVAGLGLAVLFGGLVFVVRRRLTREDVEPEYIRDMFVHHFREGNHDGLDLEFRPVFRLLDGRVRSLAEIRRIASRHGLFGAYSDTVLTSLVPQDLPLLDRSAKTVGLLEPFLPPVIWLETLHLPKGTRELSPALQDAEAIIQRMDPDFRVYQIPESATVEELNLRLNRPYDGIRHVLIGENSPLFRAIHKGYSVGETVGAFRAVQMILERTTFYTLERTTFLSRLAEELNRELSAGDDSGEGHDSPPLGNDVG